jgi:hypothetical protein
LKASFKISAWQALLKIKKTLVISKNNEIMPDQARYYLSHPKVGSLGLLLQILLKFFFKFQPKILP